MKRQSHIVESNTSPVPCKCCHCTARVGEEHDLGCVCRRRTVVIASTIEHVIDVPEDWSPEDIEFQRNESSWCANNVSRELIPVLTKARDDPDGYCLCSRYSAQYVREATEEDEKSSVVDNRYNDGLKSEVIEPLSRQLDSLLYREFTKALQSGPVRVTWKVENV